jgi:hypothetical protein
MAGVIAAEFGGGATDLIDEESAAGHEHILSGHRCTRINTDRIGTYDCDAAGTVDRETSESGDC